GDPFFRRHLLEKSPRSLRLFFLHAGHQAFAPLLGAIDATHRKVLRGRVFVAPWSELEPRETELAAWRQTPACLVHRGALHPALVTETHTRRWGAAADGGVDIPRTALAIDRTGRYALFALGDRTTAKALADALLAAGASAAAELDINWSYTRFFLYSHAHAGGAPRIVRSIGTKGQHPAASYVERRSERDFFYFARRAR
ncbi:MAG TPA: hypothetical protein PLR99_03245, partial [Polyangiaceae bacterium]|nr:hypothetical protein [Polyangiaceae bacterium]